MSGSGTDWYEVEVQKSLSLILLTRVGLETVADDRKDLSDNTEDCVLLAML